MSNHNAGSSGSSAVSNGPDRITGADAVIAASPQDKSSTAGTEKEITCLEATQDVDVLPKECDEKDSIGGDSGWTIEEETILLKYMHNLFETGFDAKTIGSLLPNKSDKDVKEKWRIFMTTLLSDLPKRGNDDVEGPADATTNEKISLRRKKRQKNRCH